MNLLALAPTPTFALLAGLSTGQENLICSASHSPLTGMVAMYLFMSVFHAGPWLTWLRRTLDERVDVARED